MRLWNPACNANGAKPYGHSGPVSALAVLADGRLASGSTDQTTRLWNPANGACEATLEGHTNHVDRIKTVATINVSQRAGPGPEPAEWRRQRPRRARRRCLRTSGIDLGCVKTR
ncbi:WD40 repeat domain-containing protein [Paraburkholderia nodosa]|uniref:WD40 repeat domain-containing protein n=1 Tax=Paraburkholderia nodosa TaxID=392320 RepID=UPI0009DC9D01